MRCGLLSYSRLHLWLLCILQGSRIIPNQLVASWSAHMPLPENVGGSVEHDKGHAVKMSALFFCSLYAKSSTRIKLLIPTPFSIPAWAVRRNSDSKHRSRYNVDDEAWTMLPVLSVTLYWLNTAHLGATYDELFERVNKKQYYFCTGTPVCRLLSAVDTHWKIKSQQSKKTPKVVRQNRLA